MLEHGEWTGEIVQRHRDGSTIEVEGRWTLVRGDDGQPQSILAINTDIRQRKASEREIQRLAFYDALTGLPNRMLLMDRMGHALANAQRRQQGGALLFIDLDNFKQLNDTLGHDQGDLLLQQVAQRLNTCVRSVDTVARLGGDEFVVMLEELSPRPHELALHARGVGEKILAMLAVPYALQGYQYRSTPSIGIAPFTGEQTTVGELLKQADLAMYQAKTAGRNTLRFFDPDMQAVVTARAGLETDLRSALMQEEDRILADRLSPASLLEAAAHSPAQLRRFRHNQPQALADLLAKPCGGQTLAVTEGVFSMDGDSAPLAELHRLTRDAGAWLMVDDAHGIGV